jgi:aldose 1-epimerase
MGSAEVASVYWERLPALELRAGTARALVLPGHGGHLLSLEDQRGPRLRAPQNLEEYLLLPEAYGAPVLFPPNRIEGNQFSAGGRDYILPPNRPKGLQIHGFLFERPWQTDRLCAEGEEAELELSYNSGEGGELVQGFPHPFRARLIYRLTEETLVQEIFFENRGERPLPFMLGYHTAFALPGREDDPESFRITVGLGDELRGAVQSPPTPEMAAFRQGRILKKGEPVFGQFTAEVGPGGTHEVLIENRSTGVRLRYLTDRAFGYWVIWNQNGRDSFICIEPQTCAINAANLHGGEDRFGFRMLAAREEFSAVCRFILT